MGRTEGVDKRGSGLADQRSRHRTGYSGYVSGAVHLDLRGDGLSVPLHYSLGNESLTLNGQGEIRTPRANGRGRERTNRRAGGILKGVAVIVAPRHGENRRKSDTPC